MTAAIQHLTSETIRHIRATMLAHVALGTKNYRREPRPSVPIGIRSTWEFEACLSGRMRAWLTQPDDEELLREHTLWVFPRLHPHGWLSDEPCERVVFQFDSVSEVLERLLPPRGYYRVSLSKADCDRLRGLARAAIVAQTTPTELREIQGLAWRGELSLIALREIKPKPLPAVQLASHRTRLALAWYADRMAEKPSIKDIARAAHVSPVHLRRLFLKASGEPPHDAFNRLRMEKARELLQDRTLTLEAISEQVGLSSASSLSRAMKAHFGFTPRQLRRDGQHTGRSLEL